MPAFIHRRRFLQSSAALAAAAWNLPHLSRTAQAAEGPKLTGRIYKTLKIGMVREPGTLTEKFKMLKEIGFDGVEMNSPGVNVQEAVKAVEASGLPIDGTVCSTHWKVRLSDPDPQTREKARQHVETALRDTQAIGGHSVLIVVGHGKDGTHEEVWNRSIEQIRKLLPLASRLGIHLVVENVWNHFCYDHDGGADQTAKLFAQYIDEIDSPWVGMQFDIGNHQKYGNPADWIRTLGKRIVKLDLKGFSREAGKFTDIGQGDIDWADVRRALDEIGYSGWAAAEVGGGNRQRLATIAGQMNEVFAL